MNRVLFPNQLSNAPQMAMPQRRRSRRRVIILNIVFFLATFFLLDFLYSRTFHNPSGNPRILDPVFHNALRPQFDGYETWGERQYRFVTNNLGFKDAVARDISPKPSTRRVVIIGDSFTEGIGMPFEDSFAGMLAEAGQRRAEKTEFLNAGLSQYSPTLYYRKIKFLLDRGYDFDELVVLPDLTDISDEAKAYFCFDDLPQYKQLCPNVPSQFETRSMNQRDNRREELSLNDVLRAVGASLQRNFAISDALRMTIKFKFQDWHGELKRDQLTPKPLPIGWSISNYDVGDAYAPLGVEGGIERALAHMQALADVLARRHIALTVAVYPWPLSLVQDDPGGRWVAIWRKFCVANCKAFIDTFPAFIAARNAHVDWYERYFISGDHHFSRAGHKIVFDALTEAGLR